MFSNPVTIYSGGSIPVSAFLMVRLHASLSEDERRTSHLHIILLKVMLHLLNRAVWVYRDKIIENDDAVHEKDTCVSGRKSVLLIFVVVVILLLETSQSRVGGLFPSLYDLRYEFWRIQKLRERFEIWDRSTRAISVVKENSVQYVRSLFFVSKICQDVSFQYMIL